MTHKHNKLLQIPAEEDFPRKFFWSENADLKFSVNNEGRRCQQETADRAETGHDDPQALETCTTVIWIDRLRNIKQRKCWQHISGPKIGNYKKSLELITRTSSCVHLANSYDILFRQEQLKQSKYAFVSSNDNRNLRKYIIDFIVKITNVFSNRATSEHSATLLKFICIVWATPKRFFVTTTWNNQTKTKPN